MTKALPSHLQVRRSQKLRPSVAWPPRFTTPGSGERASESPRRYRTPEHIAWRKGRAYASLPECSSHIVPPIFQMYQV
jgi:hypothetical protein